MALFVTEERLRNALLSAILLGEVIKSDDNPRIESFLQRTVQELQKDNKPK